MIAYFVKGPMRGQVREIPDNGPLSRYFECSTPVAASWTYDERACVSPLRHQYILVGKDGYIYDGVK